MVACSRQERKILFPDNFINPKWLLVSLSRNSDYSYYLFGLHPFQTLYENVRYTAILYLGTYKKDFVGGRVIHMDEGSIDIVEPKKGWIISFLFSSIKFFIFFAPQSSLEFGFALFSGRLNLYTSGSENRYYVEKVTSGDRYFLLFSFACHTNPFTIS